MTTMGKHSPPLDGTVTANGRALEPFAIRPLQKAGPVSVLPRQQDARPAPRRAAGGDTVIRVLAAAVVLAVAAFAAIVSYSHIFELGFHHGQDGAAARLLPLSVDGLIASASLVMLHAARRELPVPWLARAMLALGVGATVAANVGYGLPFGWLSAVISAWPAVAFVGSVEMAVRFVRDGRSAATEVATSAVVASDRSRDMERIADVAEQQVRSPRRTRQKAPSGSDRVRDILKRNPDLSKADVAKRAKVSVRTVERVIAGGGGVRD